MRRRARSGAECWTIAEGSCCKGSLGVLRQMYKLGARMMTLTWNHENELASPNVVPGGAGISGLPAQHRDRPEGAGFEFWRRWKSCI